MSTTCEREQYGRSADVVDACVARKLGYDQIVNPNAPTVRFRHSSPQLVNVDRGCHLPRFLRCLSRHDLASILPTVGAPRLSSYLAGPTAGPIELIWPIRIEAQASGKPAPSLEVRALFEKLQCFPLPRQPGGRFRNVPAVHRGSHPRRIPTIQMWPSGAAAA